MTLSVPDVSAVLTGPAPIAGSPGEAEAAALSLDRIRDEVDTCIYHCSESLRLLNASNAVSVRQLRERLRFELIPGAHRLAQDLVTGMRAFGRYAEELRHIHATAQRLSHDAANALRSIVDCARVLDETARSIGLHPSRCVPQVWHERPRRVPPEPDLTPAPGVDFTAAAVSAVANATWVTQSNLWHVSADRVDECLRRWVTLKTERSEAESALVAALRRTELGPHLNLARGTARVRIAMMITGAPVHPSRIHLDSRLQHVLSAEASPQEIARHWGDLGYSEHDVSLLPMHVRFALASADGVPARIRDAASREALSFALSDPEAAFRLLGLSHADLTIEEFEREVLGVAQGLEAATRIARDADPQAEVSLLHFGARDGVLTAAVAHGAVDVATTIGVNVSGMGSEASDAAGPLSASASLYREAGASEPSALAVVTWLGYRAPGMPPEVEVLGGARASVGAVALARFIDGLSPSRSVGEPAIERLVVFGHSYGSTTAAEALKLTTTRADAFVTYGSAGLVEGTRRVDVNADLVFATVATGDGIAPIGVGASGRVDPRHLEGVIVFSSEQTAGGLSVTAHDMYTENDDPSAFNWSGKRGYLSEGTSSLQTMGAILGAGQR